MTRSTKINIPAFLETITRQCAVKIALTKPQLVKIITEDARYINDAEIDRLLIGLIHDGYLRSSGGRFWVPRKAEQ